MPKRADMAAKWQAIREERTPPNPSGLCQCGCGQPAPIATTTYHKNGDVKGYPTRFIRGHNKRAATPYLVDEETGCWVWQLSVDRNGYGVVKVDSRTRKAHTIAYERVYGSVPDGLELDHVCRNRRCVNPDHLEAVTHTVNVRRGKRTKLTPEQVVEIRAIPKRAMTFEEMAYLYGVSVARIVQLRRHH